MSYESRMRWIALQMTAIKEIAVTADERQEEITARIDEIFKAFEDLKKGITTEDTVKGEHRLSVEMSKLELEWEAINESQ